MPDLRHYYLFVSHAWRYGDAYARMVNLLDAAPNFRYRNFSVPRAKSLETTTTAELREELRQQIRPAQVVVIVAGMYAAHSQWIKFEMDFAKSLGKPILGVRPWGAQRTPIEVVLAADQMVSWQGSSVVSAIRNLAAR